MYTSKVTVREGEYYHLISYGHGAAYELVRIDDGKSVWFQGGDAIELDSELEAIDRAWPDWPPDHALEHIWWNLGYGEVAS